MKTGSEILERREKIVMDKLKTEFQFMYDHIVQLSRKSLEVYAQECCNDELNDHANDGLHTEQLDGHHQDTSTSLDFDATKEIMDDHQKVLELIAEIYND